MGELNHAIESVLAFIERGGGVQWAIFWTVAAMWTLILERAAYLALQYPKDRQETKERWYARKERHSWHAHQVRTMLINQTYGKLRSTVPLAKTFVTVCPLLGLLGTVVGMIEVFDVMKLSGNSNARALASGVSRATTTTMAGMVAALSGLFITTQLERHASNERRRLEDALSTD
ncbi:MAG: MotA/TolQ/ExbB proton channel family protein [Myxococcales bacterium]|nr:MotA/TolQ/ExbB proton channel family protein [Myxococcales bacterium]MDD9969240.1 MotA/TolQ/ExbB proton channel family protein [Myxococcales bacterium]